MATGKMKALAAVALLAAGVAASRPSGTVAAQLGTPIATLESATPIAFAADTDSNSPSVWSLVNGRQYL